METLNKYISVELPKDIYIRISPHSGLAQKYQLNVLGVVIDANYRGSIKIMLQNLRIQPVSITQS